MRVLVTGATGFTGSHLVRHLVASGAEVRVLARRPHALPKDLPLDVCQGDVRDPDACAKAVRGVEVVYHLAASYRESGFRAGEHMAVNLDGTARLFEASAREGVRRFVYCSTVGVHGETKDGPADEEAGFHPTDPYQESKAEAERYLRAHPSPTEVVIARPSGIYGPGDTRLLKFFRLIARGRFFMIGDGNVRYHLTYVDDVVDGLVRCGTVPRAAGEAFIIAGPEAPTLNQWASVVAEVLGARPPTVHLPVGPVLALAWVLEGVCLPLGLRPPLFRRRMDFFTKSREFSTRKAQSLLGYQPRVGVREGTALTAAWYRERGLL